MNALRLVGVIPFRLSWSPCSPAEWLFRDRNKIGDNGAIKLFPLPGLRDLSWNPAQIPIDFSQMQ